MEKLACRRNTALPNAHCSVWDGMRSLSSNRSLLKLAEDERDAFPKGAPTLEENVYVDDAFAGGDTVKDALDSRNQLIFILRAAGMTLDKWSANDAKLLPDSNSMASSPLDLTESDTVSTLGLRGHPIMDHFSFKVTLPIKTPNWTKRTIL